MKENGRRKKYESWARCHVKRKVTCWCIEKDPKHSTKLSNKSENWTIKPNCNWHMPCLVSLSKHNMGLDNGPWKWIYCRKEEKQRKVWIVEETLQLDFPERTVSFKHSWTILVNSSGTGLFALFVKCVILHSNSIWEKSFCYRILLF